MSERGTCLAEIEGIGGVALLCSLPAGHEGRHRTRDGAEFQGLRRRGYGTDEGDGVEALVEATLNEDGSMHFDAVVIESAGMTGGIVCGSTTCPTCERPTTALIGPCDRCMESWERTGKFLRRQRKPG